MTVQEYVAQSGKSKYWLCPNIVVGGKIDTNELYSGYECTPSTIPEALKDKEVIKHFADTGCDCVIWENIKEKGPAGSIEDAVNCLDEPINL